MHARKIESYYRDILSRDGAMLFSLIDPDKTPLDQGAKIAKQSAEGGADVILVGGSIGAQGSVLDETVKRIKESAPNLPVTLFPGSIAGFSQYADAIYFMHMLNSRDVYWLSTAQIQAAPFIARTKVEPIPTAYLVLEPGRAVGWVGNANLVPRDRPDLAAACALAARFSGSHVLITDSGSGAPDPAPLPLITAVSKACGEEMMYFLAGGVKTAKQAEESISSGAHGIHIGTAFEEGDVLKKVRELRQAIKSSGRKRR